MAKKIFRKACTSVLAALIVMNSICFTTTTSAEATKYELEDGTMSGCASATEQSGFSGDGYVYLKDAGQYVEMNVTVPETGMYQMNIGYCLPKSMGSSKVQNLYINDVAQGDLGFTASDEFKEIKAGTYKLKEGDNKIKIVSYWGWTLLDYITIEEASLPELNVSNTLTDKNATAETQSLMNYLTDTYGNNIISGQQEIYGQAGENEFDYIYNLSGEYPAIRGFDYLNWSNAVNWNDGTNTRIDNWVNNKDGIATLCWHWLVPMDMSTYSADNFKYENAAFYTQKGDNQRYTTFSAANAVTEGTAENAFIDADIEKIATALLELQDKNIPIIFRPLHEAEGSGSLDGSGSWFWWGADGAESYVKLWKYLYNKLTVEYGVHNLIWEWNSYTYETSSEWYPGDEYVDIVAYDKYNATNWTTNVTQPNESAISGTFYSLVDMYQGKKLISMAENDTIPNVENLTSEKAGWLYFCPWYSDYITNSKYNNADTVKAIYQSDYVITLDELPADLKTYASQETETTTDTTVETTTETTVTSETTTPSGSETTVDTTANTTVDTGITDTDTTETTTEKVKPTMYGDVNLDGRVTVADVILINKAMASMTTLTAQQIANGDVTVDGKVNNIDGLKIMKLIGGLIETLNPQV